MNQNQPTRTPPTDREAYRQSLIELRNGLKKEITKLKSVIASIPEPFAPVLPVVELWEGESVGGKIPVKIVRRDRRYTSFTEKDEAFGIGLWVNVELSYTNLCRTHICEWRPCNENA